MGIFDFFKLRRPKQNTYSEASFTEERHFTGVCDTPLDAEYTPDNIMSLGRRDIFVFGSNLSGYHAKGAARTAFDRFGAIWGQGEGLQGNSYAIPNMHGGIETIRPYVDRFIEFAGYERALTFYVTKIGCGIAGFRVQDIAPLFTNAYDLPNVRLPKEFVDCIEKQICYSEEQDDRGCINLGNNEGGRILADPLPCESTNPLPYEVTTHCYGMTRTFADIILGLNQEAKYTSPCEALSDLSQYLQRFRDNGDKIAFLAVKTIRRILHEPEIFMCGRLNISRFREMVFQKANFELACDKAYDLYCKEKFINLIAYLNEFRRYRRQIDIEYDLIKIEETLKSRIFKLSYCSPTETPIFFEMEGATALNYPVRFFIQAVNNLWSEITSDGILDAEKMRKVMFGNHDETVKQFGLEETIRRNYIEDSPCHPEVLVPKVLGTAPIYVKDNKTGRFMRSCGEGKGPNSIPDWLEFQIAKQILDRQIDNRKIPEADKPYKRIGNYYIPKYDYTLPIYGEYSGRLVFNTQADKIQFIEDVKRGKDVWR